MSDLIFFVLQSGEASRWRVYYQRGLPHLVSFGMSDVGEQCTNSELGCYSAAKYTHGCSLALFFKICPKSSTFLNAIIVVKQTWILPEFSAL